MSPSTQLRIRSRARLLNADHELMAEGVCDLDEAAGQATLEVERTPGAVQSQRGNLSLELDSGRSLLVADKPILMMITPPGERPTPENRKRIYRLRIVDPMAGSKEQGTSTREQGTGKRESGQEQGTGNKEQGARESVRSGADEAQDAARPDALEPATNHITQDASAVGAAGKGRPAVSGMGRLFAEGRGETPAAR